MANDANFDRNPLRGCNYGLEGGACLILGGQFATEGLRYFLQQKMRQSQFVCSYMRVTKYVLTYSSASAVQLPESVILPFSKNRNRSQHFSTSSGSWVMMNCVFPISERRRIFSATRSMLR